MEGVHISWDELSCIGYEVTDNMFRVNLYRGQMAERQEDYDKAFIKREQSIGETSEKHRRSIGEVSETV